MSYCLYLVNKDGKKVRDTSYNVNNNYECVGQLPGTIEVNIPNLYTKAFNFQRFSGMSCQKACDKLNKLITDFSSKPSRYTDGYDYWSATPENLVKVFSKMLEYSQNNLDCSWRM